MSASVNKWLVLLVSVLSVLFTGIMVSSVNIALPSIGREFEIDAVVLGLIPTAYFLPPAILVVPFGRAADIYGRKKVFASGILLYSLASLLSSISPSAEVLISFRVLQGVGGAMIFGTSVAILTSAFPPNERGKALGFNVAAVYSGLTLGPFIGGFLTQNFGWRSVFFVNVPIGAVIIAIVALKMKTEWAEAKGERLDYPGSVIYGLTLASIMYGFTLLPAQTGIWLLAAGIPGLIVYVKWQGRVQNPILNLKLFRNNRVFALSHVAALIHYGSTFATNFLMSLYLQYIKGLSPQTAGLLLIAQPATMAIVSPFSGRLSDRIEPRVVSSIGMGLTATGLFLFSLLGENTPLELVIANLLLLGVGVGLFSSPNSNAIMGSIGRKYYGVAGGTLHTARLAGNVFSLSLATFIFATFIGRTPITPQNYSLLLSSEKTTFTIVAVLSIAGIFASLARGRLRSKDDKLEELAKQI